MTIVEKLALRYPEIGERGYDQCEAEDEKDRPAAGLSFVSVFVDTPSQTRSQKGYSKSRDRGRLQPAKLRRAAFILQMPNSRNNMLLH